MGSLKGKYWKHIRIFTFEIFLDQYMFCVVNVIIAGRVLNIKPVCVIALCGCTGLALVMVLVMVRQHLEGYHTSITQLSNNYAQEAKHFPDQHNVSLKLFAKQYTQ